MEEHVALDSKKQKKFVKSLKGIKKLMKNTTGCGIHDSNNQWSGLQRQDPSHDARDF
ncbi:hypothetical protein RR46_00720 [Papilio xuthus]|uniref:Uncharacterized protein n=1 Tax=Papilio xuthus TaxID=66420 RepID=A0A0N0P9W3_PAPXU|nr:hypothetical protein RR46_00720 [Papilio xuthus]